MFIWVLYGYPVLFYYLFFLNMFKINLMLRYVMKISNEIDPKNISPARFPLFSFASGDS